MPARIIDGRTIAQTLRTGLCPRVAALAARNCRPCLAVVLAGDDPASKLYVGNKVKACDEVGIASRVIDLPGDVSETQLLQRIAGLNDDAAVHGILVQLPLPRHIDATAMLDAIASHKDVDGFHPANIGALVVGRPVFPPCTPAGIVFLLEHENIPLWGRHAVIVGASNIVGKPVAFLLLQRGATITICNSKTPDLGAMTRQADVLVVATGKPGLIRADMVKAGAAVIDEIGRAHV